MTCMTGLYLRISGVSVSSCLFSLQFVVFQSRLDGVFSQHRAVKLDGRKGEFLSNVTVLNASRLIQVFPFDPLGGETAACYGRATAERLELGISDLTVLVNLDLQFHDVPTGGSSHQTSPDIDLLRIHLANIAGVLVVVDHLLVVESHRNRPGQPAQSENLSEQCHGFMCLLL